MNKTVCLGDDGRDSDYTNTEAPTFKLQFNASKFHALQRETNLVLEEMKMKLKRYAYTQGLDAEVFLNKYLKIIDRSGNEMPFHMNEIQDRYYEDILASATKQFNLKEVPDMGYRHVPYHQNPAPWTYQNKPIRCSSRRVARRPAHARLKVKR